MKRSLAGLIMVGMIAFAGLCGCNKQDESVDQAATVEQTTAVEVEQPAAVSTDAVEPAADAAAVEPAGDAAAADAGVAAEAVEAENAAE